MEMEMDSSMSELKVMKRSCNYSAPELECLLNHLEANPTLAAGFRPGAVLTQADFQLAWDAIAEQITAAGGKYRMPVVSVTSSISCVDVYIFIHLYIYVIYLFYAYCNVCLYLYICDDV